MAASLSACQAASALQSTVRVGAVPSTCAVHFLVVLLPQLSVAVTVISGLHAVPPVTAAVGVMDASQLSLALLRSEERRVGKECMVWHALSAAKSKVSPGAVPSTCAEQVLWGVVPQSEGA